MLAFSRPPMHLGPCMVDYLPYVYIVHVIQLQMHGSEGSALLEAPAQGKLNSNPWSLLPAQLLSRDKYNQLLITTG